MIKTAALSMARTCCADASSSPTDIIGNRPPNQCQSHITVAVDTTDLHLIRIEGQRAPGVRIERYLLPGGDPNRATLFWPKVIHGSSRGAVNVTPPARHACWPDSVCQAALRGPGRRGTVAGGSFRLRSWDRIPTEGEQPSWIELHVGNVAVLLFPLDGNGHQSP